MSINLCRYTLYTKVVNNFKMSKSVLRLMHPCLLQWEHSRVSANTVFAMELVPVDLAEVESMEKLLHSTQNKLQWWFDKVSSARTALWNAFHTGS